MKNSTDKKDTAKLDRKQGWDELLNLMKIGKIEVNRNGWTQ